MPCFFFDLAGPGVLEVDEIGTEFVDLHAGYLDACRAVLEISGEMLRDRRDPSRHRFEVRDGRGRALMDIPFREMLQPSGPAPRAHPTAEVRSALAAAVARNRELRSELSAGWASARETVAAARLTLQRARGG